MQKILIVLFSVFVFSYTVFSAVKIANSFAPDFSIFFAAAKDVAHGISPYSDKTLFTAFNYPFATAIFFIPFSLQPYKIAQSVFIFINIFSVFGIVFVCFQLLKQKVTLSKYLLFLSLIYLSFPIKFTFGMGQTNLLAYIFLLTGYLFLQKNKHKASVFFLLLGIFLKPILGLTLPVLLFQKKWKELFTLCSIGAAFFFLAPFVFHQSNANILFLNQLIKQSTLGREVYYNQGLLGFISRVTNNFLIRSVFNILGIITFTSITLIKMKKLNFVQQLSLPLTLLVIIDPLSWQHHFVFLILPFLLVCLEVIKQKSKRGFYMLLLIIAYVLVSWNVKNPQMFAAFPWSFLLSHQLYGAIILFILQVVL